MGKAKTQDFTIHGIVYPNITKAEMVEWMGIEEWPEYMIDELWNLGEYPTHSWIDFGRLD